MVHNVLIKKKTRIYAAPAGIGLSYNIATFVTHAYFVRYMIRPTLHTMVLFEEYIKSEWVNIDLYRFLHHHDNIPTEWSPKSGLCHTLIEWQHCTLQAFKHFGALYMHNLDDISDQAGILNQDLWDSSHNQT